MALKPEARIFRVDDVLDPGKGISNRVGNWIFEEASSLE